MAEKLLLHIMYECSRHRVEIPWDHVAHRLHPGSTGGAVVQHLNRLRASLIAEGHLVPPICQKPGSRVFVDPHIRGYVRKFPEDDDLVTTRPVRYDEPIEDRRFNIPDSWDTHRPSLPARVDEHEGASASSPPLPPPSTSNSTASQGPQTRNRRKRTVEKRDSSPDPADLDSDGDYAPGPKPARKQPRRSLRPSRPTYDGFDKETSAAIKHTHARAGGGRSGMGSSGRGNFVDDGVIEVEDDDEPQDNSHVFGGMSRDLMRNSYDYHERRAPDNRFAQHSQAYVHEEAYEGHGYPGSGYANSYGHPGSGSANNSQRMRPRSNLYDDIPNYNLDRRAQVNGSAAMPNVPRGNSVVGNPTLGPARRQGPVERTAAAQDPGSTIGTQEIAFHAKHNGSSQPKNNH